MTTRTELVSKIVGIAAEGLQGRVIFTALCEDGSAWVRQSHCEMRILEDGKREPYVELSAWVQLHPPHRTHEIKEPPPVAPKILRFSEVTKPGVYWVRSAVNAKWGFGVFRKDSQGLLFEFSGHMYEQTESRIDMFQGYQFVGPLPEPGVGT